MKTGKIILATLVLAALGYTAMTIRQSYTCVSCNTTIEFGQDIFQSSEITLHPISKKYLELSGLADDSTLRSISKNIVRWKDDPNRLLKLANHIDRLDSFSSLLLDDLVENTDEDCMLYWYELEQAFTNGHYSESGVLGVVSNRVIYTNTQYSVRFGRQDQPLNSNSSHLMYASPDN